MENKAIKTNKKYLHIVGNDINIFCGKAGDGADDKLSNNPLNSTHIYNALCVLFNKTPIPQKKKSGQIYDEKIFYKHADILELMENTYFKISDLSGNGKFDISKSGSHTNNTVKSVDSKPTNTVQLTWYDIKQYISDDDMYNKFRTDLSERFDINIEDSLQNCLLEFHKFSTNCNIIKERFNYIFEKGSKHEKFLNDYNTKYGDLISDIKQDPLMKKSKDTWEDYSIDMLSFYDDIKSYEYQEFDNICDFINYFREFSIEQKQNDKQYNIYKYNEEITEWLMVLKKAKMTILYNILTNNQLDVKTRDISAIYQACNKTTYRGFENSKKFKLEIKIILDDNMRQKLNNGLGYCTIGDGGLLKCVDYKEMTYHDMYGFVNIDNIDNDNFWKKIRK